MLTILVFFAVLSTLVLVHELGHFTVARLLNVEVEEFGIGMFIRLFSIKKGETTYSINAIPIGGFVRLKGEDGDNVSDPRSFAAQSKLKRVLILGSGVMMNFLLAIILFTIVFWIGMPEWGGQIKISEVSSNSPAEISGIRPNDVILKAEGEVLGSSTELQEITKAHLGENLSLEIKRENSLLNLEVLAREDPPAGEGSMGLQMTEEPMVVKATHYSLWQAPIEAVKLTFSLISEMIIGLLAIFQALFKAGQVPEGVSGPIGISQIFNQLIKFGIAPILQFSGIFSLNLMLLNILPFPALDGGRIFFIGIESVLRRKIPAKVEGMIHAGGLVVLMILMLLVTYRDILRVIH